VDTEKRKSLGTKLRAKFLQYESDRTPLEQQWLKNFRQFRGVYDSEVMKNIPDGRSKVYPKDTQVKVLGFVAKIMELMFPANEKNWTLTPSPVPDIAQADVQAIIDALNTKAQQSGEPVTNSDIEKAVYRFAEDRARAMETEMNDQLSEAGYVIMARKALRSGGVYGYGVTKGPIVEFRKRRSWDFNEELKQYEAKVQEVPVPFYEPVKVWDLYPDLSAQEWKKQEGLFERLVFSRNDLYKLTEDGAFDKVVIKEFLMQHKEGNYKRRSYETELANVRKGDTGFQEIGGRHYEVTRWFGFLDAKEMKEAGVDVPMDMMECDVLMDVWMLEDNVIRANVAPFGEKPSDMYHAFVAEEDEEVGITGIGMPEKLRDTQMKLCSIDRMTMDNAAACAGPIIEVNEDLVAKGQDTRTVHSFMVIRRLGDGPEAAYPAVRDIPVESHVAELLGFREKVEKQMDVESNLPSFLFGNTQGLGEAFRTTSNMSMLQGGAMMVTKDTIRSFDRWIESIIGSLYQWNMEFNDKETIKGDFEVMAKGTNSLVAKELRGIALDQFITTLDPEEKQLLNRRDILIDRLQARDLPVERVVNIEKAEQIMAQFYQSQAAAAQSEQAAADAQTKDREASAGLKQVQAEVLMEKTPVDNAEAMSRIHESRGRIELGQTKQQQEAVGKLVDTLQQERQMEMGKAAVNNGQ